MKGNDVRARLRVRDVRARSAPTVANTTVFVANADNRHVRTFVRARCGFPLALNYQVLNTSTNRGKHARRRARDVGPGPCNIFAALPDAHHINISMRDFFVSRVRLITSPYHAVMSATVSDRSEHLCRMNRGRASDRSAASGRGRWPGAIRPSRDSHRY